VVHNYFSKEASLYKEGSFERRFGCPRMVVKRVWWAIEGCNPFVLKKNRAGGKLGIQPLVHFVAYMMMLVYGDPVDRLDGGLQLSESTLNEALQDFSG